MWCDNCLLILPLRAGAIAWAAWIFAYSLAGGIFLLKFGEFFFFNFPEAQIYGGISMGVMSVAAVTAIALSNRSYIWIRVCRFGWLLFLILSPVRAIVMIVELNRNGDKVAWECANGGQMWSQEAYDQQPTHTDATLPGGFCLTGFNNLRNFFIVGLCVDIICQAYMFFLTWRYSKRLEHYAALKGPVFGGYYNSA